MQYTAKLVYLTSCYHSPDMSDNTRTLLTVSLKSPAVATSGHLGQMWLIWSALFQLMTPRAQRNKKGPSMEPGESERCFLIWRLSLKLEQPIKLLSLWLRQRWQEVGLLQREHWQFFQFLASCLVA